MNVITISRDYGAGGYEVAHRLAQALGWELLDRELLHQAAELEHLPDAEIERLDEKAISLADRLRLDPPHAKYIHGLREAANRAAARGNVVLVGRGTAQLLPDSPNILHLRLVAPREWRARRMAGQENWSDEQALARCTEEDSVRERFLRYFFGQEPFQPEQYALILNTGRVPLDDVVDSVVALVREDSGTEPMGACRGRRVLTLARQHGAWDTRFSRTLADRLRLPLFDRELLEQEANRLGVKEDALERIDEQAAGFFQRLLPIGLHHRYRVALGQLMQELAQRGEVILVGRGGSRFLRDDSHAFHVRVVARMDVRVVRVMEEHWLRAEPSGKLIADSDSQRHRFYQDLFAADWSDPLEYHLTVNTGRLGPGAVDLIARAAQLHWKREGQQ